ncbi:MAG TPA: hypothetical protein VG756_31945 [Pseudonocardiaceae bacterium]|jgi:hypothetical protein|nr:hypothetical protein [Pseudonocardiaceae bacterium]
MALTTEATPVVCWPGETADALVIYSPFTARVHARREQLHIDTDRWIRQQGLFSRCADADELTERFLSHRYAEVHARMWPDADYPDLWLANRLLTHMWCLDNFLDEIWGADQDDRVSQVTWLIGEVFAGRTTQAQVAAEPMAAVLRELWSEAQALAPDHWLARTAQVFLDYLAATRAERERRWSAQPVPSTAEYLACRNDNGGMFYAGALIELAGRAWLDGSLHSRPEITDLTLRLNHAMAWANDLFAYQRESDHGNGCNLMVTLTTHDGLTESQAAARIVELVNAELATLSFLTEAAETLPDPAARYAEGVRTTASGLLSWMAVTARYANQAAQAR